jgi:hypothetical protein
MTALVIPPTSEEVRQAASQYFDVSYYLATNPDVAAAGVDPFSHFLRYGWREGRNPSHVFDVRYYLSANPDVANAGINPLLHYAWAGMREGRQPRRPLDAFRRGLEASKAPHQREAYCTEQSEPMTFGALTDALESTIESVGLILSVSHDDHVRNYGSVQNLIGDECVAFERADWSYLHISPVFVLPMLAAAEPVQTFRVALRLGGLKLGVVKFTDLIGMVSALRNRHMKIELIVHHLIGHSPELLLALIECIGARPIVWVHDFFSICPSHALMRNDVAYCGAPGSGSTVCGLCAYGVDRNTHAVRVRAFFEAARPIVLAPSTAALELWQARSGLPCSEAEVLPLARLVMSSAYPLNLKMDDQRPLRIAHLGARSPYLFKGWPIFEELASRFCSDRRYRFYQLGVTHGPATVGSIKQVAVRVDSTQRNAMIEAVAEHRIDVVLCWSLWPETFCYVAHEALAGGAFIVARKAAGNVWPAIVTNAPGQGCVVDDEPGLFELFESGPLLGRVNASGRRRGALIRGRGTFDWLQSRISTAGELVNGYE